MNLSETEPIQVMLAEEANGRSRDAIRSDRDLKNRNGTPSNAI